MWTNQGEAKRARISFTSGGRVRFIPHCRRSILSAGGLTWSSADIALAASLLETPDARYPNVNFASQEEKRRVFTLVYDVLRCKCVTVLSLCVNITLSTPRRDPPMVVYEDNDLKNIIKNCQFNRHYL